MWGYKWKETFCIPNSLRLLFGCNHNSQKNSISILASSFSLPLQALLKQTNPDTEILLKILMIGFELRISDVKSTDNPALQEPSLLLWY